MAFCSKCGAPLTGSAKFCPRCGSAVRSAAQGDPVPPAAPAPSPVQPTAQPRVENPIESIPTPPPPPPAAQPQARVESPIGAIPTPPPAQPEAAAPVQAQAQPDPAPRSAAAQTAVRTRRPLPKWVGVVVIAAVIFAVFWFFIRKNPVQDVKDYVFYEYGTVPFGVVVDTILPGSRWSSSGSGATYMVTASASYLFVPVSMTFQVTYAGDVPHVRFLSASALGEVETDSYYVICELYEMYSGGSGW